MLAPEEIESAIFRRLLCAYEHPYSRMELEFVEPFFLIQGKVPTSINSGVLKSPPGAYMYIQRSAPHVQCAPNWIEEPWSRKKCSATAIWTEVHWLSLEAP